MLRRIEPPEVLRSMLLVSVLALIGCPAIYADLEALRAPADASVDAEMRDVDAIDGAEVGPTCRDGVQNQGEEGRDCGGPCPACNDGCQSDDDCGGSGVCTAEGTCTTCSDGVQNGRETDVDCGAGGDCPKCDSGQSCQNPGDCRSHRCRGGVCG